jgi:recombination protein RecT
MTEVKRDAGASRARQAVAGTDLVAADGDLRAMAERMEPKIVRALPPDLGIDAGHFVRTVQTELSKTPELRSCSPVSFMGAVISSAQLGLEFGPLGHAYMIPRKNRGVLEVQFTIGYKGWLALAHRSERLASVVAREVRENDEFEYAYGLEDVFHHRPADSNRGAATHYYCVAKIRNGAPVLQVISAEEARAHRDRYAPRNREKQIVGPWSNFFDEMALKTVFKRVYRWLPMTAQMGVAGAVDDAIVKREDVDDDPVVEFDEDEIVDGEIVGEEKHDTAYDRGE